MTRKIHDHTQQTNPQSHEEDRGEHQQPHYINQFMLNGISYCYQLDQSISVLRVDGWYFIFIFYSNFKRNLCLQTAENLIRRRVLRRLFWFCTVCQCPTKTTLGLYGFRKSKYKCKAASFPFLREIIANYKYTY